VKACHTHPEHSERHNEPGADRRSRYPVNRDHPAGRRVERHGGARAAVAGEAVGGIGFTVQFDVARRSAEIGYWVGEEFWGRGIATEALIAVTNHAFSNYDVCRLFAHVFDWNGASARVLEKAGYEFEGRLKKSVTKNGQTIDQLMYAAIRD
jgi:RimJ/RimL family protein N-acetyltransferase